MPSVVRDPLMLVPSPWELLDLPSTLLETIREQLLSEQSLTGPELTARIDRELRTAVDRAFTRALRNRVPPQRAKVARDALLRPTGRALADLLLIPRDTFARLAGDRGAEVLEPPARSATADAWESHFATHLDDLPAAHALAVLWWHRVHWEEERASPRSSADDRFGMWCALIGYLGLLSAQSAFVAARHDLSEEDARTVLASLVETLKGELLDRAQAAGVSLEAQRYRLLERFLDDEVHAARVMRAAHLELGGVECAPGPRLLARLGRTYIADDLFRHAAARDQSPAIAAALRLSLSPCAVMERLAHAGKSEQALELLAILPPHEQTTPAAERAGAVAHSCLAVKRFEELVDNGREEDGLDLVDGALGAWPFSAALQTLIATRRYQQAVEAVTRIRAERVARADAAGRALTGGQSTLRSTRIAPAEHIRPVEVAMPDRYRIAKIVGASGAVARRGEELLDELVSFFQLSRALIQILEPATGKMVLLAARPDPAEPLDEQRLRILERASRGEATFGPSNKLVQPGEKVHISRFEGEYTRFEGAVCLPLGERVKIGVLYLEASFRTPRELICPASRAPLSAITAPLEAMLRRSLPVRW